MGKLIKTAVFLTCLLVSNIALAESGNELLSQCNDYSVQKGTFEQGVCLGIVMGVAETSDKICPPKEVTNKQLVLVVEKFLKENPQDLHFPATSLAEYALAMVWPCQIK